MARYCTFHIGNMTSEFGLGFSYKESNLGLFFLILFSLLK